jgi:hypothetical protein
MFRWRLLTIVVVCFSFVVIPSFAQSQDSAVDSQDAPSAGAPGTRFVVTLDTRISTKQDKAGKPFLARTVDTVTTEDGTVLPPGTPVRGHVVKIRPADQMSKARLWLAFDEIKTPRGWAPLAAGVIDMPDEQKLHVLFDREGAIEISPVKRDLEIYAALAAAMAGAAPGVAAKNSKDAATGAAAAAVEAYMATSGMGQELTLEQNMKLELVLQRPLHSRRT